VIGIFLGESVVTFSEITTAHLMPSTLPLVTQFLNNRRLHVRAVNQVLERYPVALTGHTAIVHPHDLRRTYARRLYEAGVDLLAIQQNLGHADSKTTLKYIGVLDVSARRPPALYDFDLSTLKKRRKLEWA
jgi:site-specific recombinase XerD